MRPPPQPPPFRAVTCRYRIILIVVSALILPSCRRESGESTYIELREAPPPTCYGHHKPAVKRQVKKDSPNKGRWFWTCAQTPQCRFFSWADAAEGEGKRAISEGETGKGGGRLGDRVRSQNAKVARTIQMVRTQGRRHTDDNVPPFPPDPYLHHVGTQTAFSEPKPGTRVHPEPTEARPVYSDVSSEYGSEEGKAKVKVVLSIWGKGVFAASSSFDQNLINIYRSLPYECNAHWSREDSCWLFSINPGLQMLKVTLKQMPQYTLEEIYPKALKALEEPNECYTAACHTEARTRFERIPESIREKLYPFQREGVMFGLRHKGRLLIADEMGLGKTVQGIALAMAYREEWPLLIICPSAMRETWHTQLKTWIPEHLRTRIITIHSNSDIKDLDRMLEFEATANLLNITIVSYDLAQKLHDINRYNVIICDESHLIKTISAQRTKFILPILKRCSRVVLVSGTPALSRPIELYPQIDAVSPGILGSLEEFGDRYCRPPRENFNYAKSWNSDKYRGSSFEKELHTVLKSRVLIRRMKKDVLKELPKKVRKVTYLSLSKRERSPLEALLKEIEAISPHDSKSKDSLISAYYRATGPAKVQVAAQFLKPMIKKIAEDKTEGKILIFAHHREVLDGLERELLFSVPFIRIDGQTTSLERSNRVQSFQMNKHIRVGLLSLLAGGVGITLTAATKVVFVELTWTPGDLIQAEDRAHRVGQTRPVEIYYLLAPGSCDDFLWSTVRKKLGVVGESVDGTLYREAQKRLAVTRADGKPVEKPTPQPKLPRGFDPGQSSLAQYNLTVFQPPSGEDPEPLYEPLIDKVQRFINSTS
ncbi:hypothetical protein AAMO2058_000732400 [Amorphochlora amoebiformis]